MLHCCCPHYAAGALPDQLSSATSLVFLDLSYNADLTGCIPESWTALQALSILNIQGTAVAAEKPSGGSWG